MPWRTRIWDERCDAATKEDFRHAAARHKERRQALRAAQPIDTSAFEQQQESGLLSLPPEIRNVIYEYVFGHGTIHLTQRKCTAADNISLHWSGPFTRVTSIDDEGHPKHEPYVQYQKSTYSVCQHPGEWDTAYRLSKKPFAESNTPANAVLDIGAPFRPSRCMNRTGEVEILDERPWKISEPLDTKSHLLAGYHTVSYTWGIERSPNMFGFSDEISSRTRGALEAAIRANTNSYIQAYWIDAVCVPRSGPERIATLESMGLIYSRATCCIVLLERSTFFAVWRSARGRARDTDIATIDREPWIRSVWTYQEVVNASTITITTFDLETPMRMDGNDLFSTTGKALRDVEENADVRGWDLAQRYPGISALEGTLADWQVGEYLGMSALTCLTGIAGRHCDPERPSNRLFALFGVLTNEASWQTSDEEGVTSLTEEAIRLCERNGDFSFIYTSNVRESSANRRWRPLPDPEHGLLPILRWHSWGVGQPGTLTDFGLELHDMAPLESSSEPSSEAVKAVQYWLQSFSGTKPHSIEEIHAQLPTDLSKLGLKPGAKCTTSNHGFIMTSFDLTPAEEVHYFAAASLCWTFGAPGIAKIVKQGVLKRCIPIVHVGRQFQDVTDRVSVQLW